MTDNLPHSFASTDQLLTAYFAAQDRIAELERDLAHLRNGGHCEACGDHLEPVRMRCERHAWTEPGDADWTMEVAP